MVRCAFNLSGITVRAFALLLAISAIPFAYAQSLLQPAIYRDDFEASSCLKNTALRNKLNAAGELELSMHASAVGLQTLTKLSYGRYMVRMRTDMGGGAVAAFYLMGVDNALRNNPFYWRLHDEVDIELVATLWREGRPLAKNASWINAFHNHSALILPRRPYDDAGGSVLAVEELRTEDSSFLNRHVLPDMDRDQGFVGFNFNDGNFYTYIIDYNDQQIHYTVTDDQGQLLRRYTLQRRGRAWPQTKMYLALSLWSTRDRGIQNNFTGPYDYTFGRPMRVFIDYVSYQPQAGVRIEGSETWGGAMPWNMCSF